MTETKMAATTLGIGALAALTRSSVPTIRYYEEIRLIPAAQRRASGHRFYGGEMVELLRFIRHCRDFGFGIEQVRELVSLAASEQRDCVETRDIAQIQLDTVRTKLAELQTLERSLSRLVKSCSEQCAGGPATRCTIVQDLGKGRPQVVNSGCCS